MPREIDVNDPRLHRDPAGVGWVRAQLVIPITIPAGTGAAEIITDHNPGYKRVIESAAAFVGVAGAGAGATRTLRIIKNAATVVASATVTLAGTATLGTLIDLPVTAADAEFLDADTFTVDFASGGTAFTGGQLNLIVNYRTRPQAQS